MIMTPFDEKFEDLSLGYKEIIIDKTVKIGEK